jgi:hypothetical protein
MSLTKDTLLKLKIVKTLIDAKNIETHYTVTRLMIVTVNLEFINKTCDPTKIFKIGSRKIRPGLVGRSSPPMLMTKQGKFLHSGHFLGVKLLNFLSYFYCIILNYC